MKKLFAILAVCGFAFTFVACGGQKAETATEEAVEEVEAPVEAVEEAPVEADTVQADTTAVQ